MKSLKKILAIIAIIVAICFFILAAFIAIGWLTIMTASTALWIGFGALVVGYVISPKTASHYVGRATQAVVDVAKGAGKAIGSGVGSVATGLWKATPPLVRYALLGALGIWAYNSLSSTESSSSSQSTKTSGNTDYGINEYEEDA